MNSNHANTLKIIENIFIMVVDDVDHARKTTTRALEEFGFNVVAEAKGAREAISKLGTTHINMMVIDLVMPDMSGVELARLVTENYKDKIAIVMTSVLQQEKTIIECISSGAADFVPKPFSAHTLSNIVYKVAERRLELAP